MLGNQSPVHQSRLGFLIWVKQFYESFHPQSHFFGWPSLHFQNRIPSFLPKDIPKKLSLKISSHEFHRYRKPRV